ncbi:hypothetical protein GXB85_14435 [Cellulomonas sp. APG4]|uniref:hypothetical protein n=1 Tax=Cellulomonas sp. APG4 TaxID=1538656 RepID=UPI00137A9213|nr:hypothetical protein [Cellulomonas sp. APG4]NCT92142.1 hypothetical protein [Cellulomonas sp. APG4]
MPRTAPSASFALRAAVDLRPPARRTAVALLAGLCLALAACSGATPQADPAPPPPAPTKESDNVATLQTEEDAEEPPSSEAVDPLVERYGEPVRLRLDFSDEEETAAYARFDECVEGESGIDPMARRMAAAGDGEVGPATVDEEETAALEAAHEACMVVAPLPPWEWDVQNPDAVDFAQAVVDCLRDAGVTYVEVTQDAGQVSLAFGGEDNHGPSISLGLENVDRCEQEAAASGAGG